MGRLIRLLIAYDGTGYSGWQRQHHAPSIQGTIEESLARICGHPVTLHGAGRTDAGVHALGMVAHFQTTAGHPLAAFCRGLSSLLPPQIRILDAREASAGFHSRFSALAKTYRYDFFVGPVLCPTRRLYTAQFRGSFDLEAVQAGMALLTGTHDFSSFEGSGSRNRDEKAGRGGVRTIYRIDCRPGTGEGYFVLRVTGDGFLRHMVRNIAGTLVFVGQGRIRPAALQEILAARDRRRAGPTAPAQGLFLEKIYYSQEELDRELAS